VATVLAAVLVVALVAIAIGGVHIGSAVVARHRAQASADLAVLAAAAWLPAGRHAACRTADGVSVAMGASVRRCDVDELDVVLTVSVGVGGWVGAEARASARAGPLD